MTLSVWTKLVLQYSSDFTACAVPVQLLCSLPKADILTVPHQILVKLVMSISRMHLEH